LNISTPQFEASDGLHHLQRPCGSPLILAIEASTPEASLALASDEEILRYIPLDRQSRTAATISVALADLLAFSRHLARPVQSVAVTDGPGSFTGLRIGVTTAKALAYALPCKLVPVDSLACMASQLWKDHPSAPRVTVALNAYRGQYFIASWTRVQWDDACNQTGDFTTQSTVVDAEQWMDMIRSSADNDVFGAEPIILQRCPSDRVTVVCPSAREVVALALIAQSHGRDVSPLHLLPRYLRDSAAEEKLRSQ
jgi:tRNA threonylcarbamoyladenosine biosynthesis protein TsaB